MVLVQKWPFFKLFFLANIGQENVFYDILETKNTFLDNKNNMQFKKVEKLTFLVQRWLFLPLFFFKQYRPGKCFYHILERENAFLGYKKKKFKKLKNWHFSKGVNQWFLSKNGHFPNFFYLAIYARKTSFMIF